MRLQGLIRPTAEAFYIALLETASVVSRGPAEAFQAHVVASDRRKIGGVGAQKLFSDVVPSRVEYPFAGQVRVEVLESSVEKGRYRPVAEAGVVDGIERLLIVLGLSQVFRDSWHSLRSL
jgi:hypothetical protein